MGFDQLADYTTKFANAFADKPYWHFTWSVALSHNFVVTDISRMSTYGNDGDCVDLKSLKPFCFCDGAFQVMTNWLVNSTQWKLDIINLQGTSKFYSF